jgi:hypothetical protein
VQFNKSISTLTTAKWIILGFSLAVFRADFNKMFPDRDISKYCIEKYLNE